MDTTSASSKRILLTGATGYVGGRLLPELLAAGHTVRCLVRDPSKAQLPDDVEVVEGDVLKGTGLREALEGCEIAYYLVHGMGRGSGSLGDFARRDHTSATNFAEAVAAAGVGRTIYLGGLEGSDDEGEEISEHLRSRHEVALVMRELVPEFVYVRAAMVIGSGSASFEILSHLVRRLPAMLTPKWVETRSQPVAIRDVVGTLARLAVRHEVPAEVQLGGADVLTYREMMERFADVAGKRQPTIIKVPVLSPKLSSYWVSLITPIEAGLARPLVEGLSAETVVRRAPPAGINDDPLSFEEAVREALDVAGART